MSTSFLCEIYYILLATGVTTIVYHNTMTAEKVWNDSDNIYGKRPSELMVDLYRGQSKGDKAVLVKTVILNAENEWQFTVSDLP